MTQQIHTTPAPGWVGGFAQSDPAFAKGDLSALDMLCNMDNIDKLDRQQAVLWPEFSWETELGEPKSRCYQMFVPNISRLGYTDTGRVYSIICPQQGACSPGLGFLNVEVSVTVQRGWVDETGKALAADLTVEGKVWFSPSARENGLVKLLWSLFSGADLPFPSDKANAIRVATHRLDDPDQPIFPLRSGHSPRFESPEFAKHPEAWDFGCIDVQIGAVAKTGNAVVDDFNMLVMDVFNLSSGNLLKQGNVLSWNVWFEAPQLVDRDEWRKHAETWRDSIDADHGSPDGDGTDPRYFDGTPFKAGQALVQHEIDRIIAFLREHLLRV